MKCIETQKYFFKKKQLTNPRTLLLEPRKLTFPIEQVFLIHILNDFYLICKNYVILNNLI